MSVKVRDVVDAVNDIAPFELAESWDNPGLLAGRREREVRRILCALDLNFGVLEEAVAKGVDLIVTHHPIMFLGRKNLCEDDAEGRLLCGLIRADIALIAAHTNFDSAQPGVNDALAERLGLTDIECSEEGMRIGTCAETTLAAFRDRVAAALGAPVRVYGEDDAPVRRVAMLGGAGGNYAAIALAAGADTYITGEIAHHKAWDAYSNGMNILECGHAATELPAIALMARELRRRLPEGIDIIESSALLFR